MLSEDMQRPNRRLYPLRAQSGHGVLIQARELHEFRFRDALFDEIGFQIHGQTLADHTKLRNGQIMS